MWVTAGIVERDVREVEAVIPVVGSLSPGSAESGEKVIAIVHDLLMRARAVEWDSPPNVAVLDC